jgi:hypothetical protein
MDGGINMKKLIVFAILLIAPFAYADTWCMWSGTEGENCRSDNLGSIRMPSDLSDKTLANNVISGTEGDYNAVGFYKLTTTQPEIGENQVRDAEVWDKVDNQITRTWTVRDLTAEEIDNRIASPMSVTNYYIWKALIATEVLTIQQAQNNLPQELIDAYQARKRLLGD